MPYYENYSQELFVLFVHLGSQHYVWVNLPKSPIVLVSYLLYLSSRVSRIMNIKLKGNSLWLDMLPCCQSRSSFTPLLTYFLLSLSLDREVVVNFLAAKVKHFDNPSNSYEKTISNCNMSKYPLSQVYNFFHPKFFYSHWHWLKDTHL